MKMIILGGFLGAGKTSLVLHMARYLVGKNSDKPAKVVILENEIGEASIDDKILNNEGFNVETMFSGCVCCTMAGELAYSIYRIKQNLDPDWIIMEATGVAYPLRIKENLEQDMNIELCKIICVADAKRWLRIQRAMANFVHDQLDSADVIFINKIDKVDRETLLAVEDSIRTYNESAKLFCISAIGTIDNSIWTDIFM